MSRLSIPCRSFKRIICWAGSVLTTVLLLGACGAVENLRSSVDPASVRSLDEVAVVSISASDLWRRELGKDRSAENPLGEIRKQTEQSERRAYPSKAAMMRTRDYIFGEFQSVVPFSLAEETPILESAAYQTFDVTEGRLSEFASQRADSSSTTPDGYRAIGPLHLQGRKLQELFGLLPSDPDGVLFVGTQYTVITDNVKHEERDERIARAKKSREEARKVAKSTPLLTKGDTVFVDVKAKTRMQLIDRQGNTVLEVVRSARSDQRFRFIFGQGWTAEDIDGPTMEATEQALNEITAYLRETVSK